MTRAAAADRLRDLAEVGELSRETVLALNIGAKAIELIAALDSGDKRWIDLEIKRFDDLFRQGAPRAPIRKIPRGA